MAAFDGDSDRAEEPVSGGCDPGTRREGNFKKTHSGGCSALAVLDEHDMLTGFEVQADAMRKENSDKLSIMAPILESEDVYGSFKSDSDYYLYDKLSRDETIDRIYSDMYKK